MTVKLVSNRKIAETSSKGNQEKWLDDGKWYKLDQFGYEALAETGGLLRQRVGQHFRFRHDPGPWMRGFLRRLDEESQFRYDFLQ